LIDRIVRPTDGASPIDRWTHSDHRLCRTMGRQIICSRVKF